MANVRYSFLAAWRRVGSLVTRTWKERDARFVVTVPVHSARDRKPGALRGIIRQAGMTMDTEILLQSGKSGSDLCWRCSNGSAEHRRLIPAAPTGDWYQRPMMRPPQIGLSGNYVYMTCLMPCFDANRFTFSLTVSFASSLSIIRWETSLENVTPWKMCASRSLLGSIVSFNF